MCPDSSQKDNGHDCTLASPRVRARARMMAMMMAPSRIRHCCTESSVHGTVVARVAGGAVGSHALHPIGGRRTGLEFVAVFSAIQRARCTALHSSAGTCRRATKGPLLAWLLASRRPGMPSARHRSSVRVIITHQYPLIPSPSPPLPPPPPACIRPVHTPPRKKHRAPRCLGLMTATLVTAPLPASEPPVRIGDVIGGHVHPALCVTQSGAVLAVYNTDGGGAAVLSLCRCVTALPRIPAPRRPLCPLTTSRAALNNPRRRRSEDGGRYFSAPAPIPSSADRCSAGVYPGSLSVLRRFPPTHTIFHPRTLAVP